MKLNKGYIQVYTGNGKGKTSAALGLALRASAAGLRVFFGQFCKGRACSEHKGLKKLGKNITVRQSGDKCFIKSPTRAHIKEAGLALFAMEKVIASGRYDVVILDEVCVASALGLIDENRLITCLKNKPAHVEIVCTGRGASKKLVGAADLVTEMREAKHYYKSRNVPARKGIEY
jgi:cob(I)alamin adenosyltransferase